jgi:nicotinamidase-related amidase
MDVNQIDIKNTGLLFFDLLNIYCHGAAEEIRNRMKPVVDNAVRLMNAARQGGIPICYAIANHRKDGNIRSMILTDTDMQLRPWPGAECNPSVHGATEGSWEQTVISEIQPQPQDYIIPKYRSSTFQQTYFDLALRSGGIDTIIIAGAPSTSALLPRPTPRAI